MPPDLTTGASADPDFLRMRVTVRGAEPSWRPDTLSVHSNRPSGVQIGQVKKGAGREGKKGEGRYRPEVGR